jgi:Zn-finger nucleic acid-binding protein
MSSYERAGVVIDQCTECRGIFLDRGELERLLDLASGDVAPAAQPQWATPAPDRSWRPAPVQSQQWQGQQHRDWDHDSDSDRYRRSQPGGYPHHVKKKSKKHSMLKELLDF